MWKILLGYYGGKIFWMYWVSSSLLVLVVSYLIFMEKRNPYKTIAWLAILNVFPILGFLLYVVVGQNLRKRKRVRSKYINALKRLESTVRHQIDSVRNGTPLEAGVTKTQLVNLLLRNANAPFTSSNKVDILGADRESFDRIFAELSQAKHHIHIESYIIRDDETGRELKQILLDRAAAGVEVRVIYDAVGSWKLPKSYIWELRRHKVQIYPFLPVVMPFINNKLNYRNHRKIIVIDGTVGFVGGLNIGDEYRGHHPKLGQWRDTHMRLEGSAVQFLQVIFHLDWEFVSRERLESPSYFPEAPEFAGKPVQIASSGPDSDWESIRQSYFAMISTAQKSIKVTTPYLIPDEGILLALKTASLSGVDVRILLPGRPDHKIVYWASQSYFGELIEAGIKIYTFTPGFVHGKVLSVDGEVASLGSANLDTRSFQLNFEVNAIIYDTELVSRLDSDFNRDMGLSKRVRAADLARWPKPVIARQSAARLLSPIL